MYIHGVSSTHLKAINLIIISWDGVQFQTINQEEVEYNISMNIWEEI